MLHFYSLRKMSKFKITIAIPTFNRVDRLNQLIESIESQYIPKEVDLKVAISNTASQDDTFTYLNLLSKFDSHKYIIQNKIKYVPNWYNLISIVPADSHYVWLIGDDDDLQSCPANSVRWNYHCRRSRVHPGTYGALVAMHTFLESPAGRRFKAVFKMGKYFLIAS